MISCSRLTLSKIANICQTYSQASKLFYSCCFPPLFWVSKNNREAIRKDFVIRFIHGGVGDYQKLIKWDIFFIWQSVSCVERTSCTDYMLRFSISTEIIFLTRKTETCISTPHSHLISPTKRSEQGTGHAVGRWSHLWVCCCRVLQ